LQGSTGRDGSAEQKALRMMHTVSHDSQGLPLGLDALRRDAQVKTAAKANDGSHENIALGRHAEFLNEAHAPRPLAAARRRTGFFLTVRSWRRKKRPTALRLPGMRAAFFATMTSSSVKSGCAAIRSKNHCAYFSNGDTLPPLGLAVLLPVSYQRRTHLMTALGLTPNCSAASWREAPDSTSTIARLRRSFE